MPDLCSYDTRDGKVGRPEGLHLRQSTVRGGGRARGRGLSYEAEAVRAAQGAGAYSGDRRAASKGGRGRRTEETAEGDRKARQEDTVARMGDKPPLPYDDVLVSGKRPEGCVAGWKVSPRPAGRTRFSVRAGGNLTNSPPKRPRTSVVRREGEGGRPAATCDRLATSNKPRTPRRRSETQQHRTTGSYERHRTDELTAASTGLPSYNHSNDRELHGHTKPKRENKKSNFHQKSI